MGRSVLVSGVSLLLISVFATTNQSSCTSQTDLIISFEPMKCVTLKERK